MLLFGREWFEGGFIGVDIFFVISGYLIARIILSEVQTNGSFSFSHFYERRARRILPVLFVVIFVSIPYAWHKLLPSDFVEYAESILASLFFGANFFFYFSTTEYGADSSLLKPFLHTWSLGVEEQFYLVFPIIAVVAFKFFRKHVLTILVGLSLLSIQFAELMEVRNSDLNFYLPFSRFWELAIGSMLAYRELNYRASNEGIGAKTLPMLGLYLIAHSILFFDSKTPHPSFYTLMPILGVALIIGFSTKDELVGKLLGSKPFVWVGLISYSAYLWHYPIFAFSRLGEEPSNVDKLEWIALTLVLSIASYFLVEKRFRSEKIVNSKILFSTLILSFISLGGMSTFAIYKSGFPSRLPPLLQSDPNEYLGEALRTVDGKLCYGWYKKDSFCSYGHQKSLKNLYIVGDSNMQRISEEIIDIFSPSGYRITTMNSSACYFIPHSFSGVDGKARSIRNEPCDEEFQNWRLSEILKTNDNLIIIGGMLDVYLRQDNGLGFESANSKSIEENFLENINLLTSNGSKIVLVYPYPRSKKHMGIFVFNELSKIRTADASSISKRVNKLIEKTSYPSKDFYSYSKKAFELLDSIESDNVIRVYPHHLFCDKNQCQFLNETAIYIADRNHPTRFLAPQFAELIYNEVKKKGW